MNWQIVLGLNILIFALAQLLFKLIVGKLPRAQALSLQFLIVLLAMSSYFLAVGRGPSTLTLLAIAPLGFINAWGAYCQWRAIDISLSRTNLFFPLAGVLTAVLAAVFLGEAREWNLRLISGIILCFTAVFLFRSQSEKGKKTILGKGNWLIFIAGMVLIFGANNFLMKVLASDIPREEFLLPWYLGAFLGSLPLLYWEKQNPLKWPGKLIFLVPLSSLAILGYLATQYWAFQLTLASRVMPFQAVGATFLPVLTGWFLFKERKGLAKKEWLAFFAGIAGALLVIAS